MAGPITVITGASSGIAAAVDSPAGDSVRGDQWLALGLGDGDGVGDIGGIATLGGMTLLPSTVVWLSGYSFVTG